MESELRERCAAIAQATGVSFTLDNVAQYRAAVFHDECIAAVRNSARDLGLPYMDVVSGAGHDAIYLNRIVPTGMIFVPCDGGISHNELENAQPEHLEAGCNVLLRAMLQRVGDIQS
jgi:N-carbamoyl-L-amino-acid hydrolase